MTRDEDRTRDEDGHLRYLLTAYIFDNISDAGRLEVEAHLESCAACRAERDELRTTRERLEEALDSRSAEDEEPYSFEAHRLERIRRAASRQRRSGLRSVALWGTPLAAASLLLALFYSTFGGREGEAPGSSVAQLDQMSSEGFWADSSAGKALGDDAGNKNAPIRSGLNRELKEAQSPRAAAPSPAPPSVSDGSPRGGFMGYEIAPEGPASQNSPRQERDSFANDRRSRWDFAEPAPDDSPRDRKKAIPARKSPDFARPEAGGDVLAIAPAEEPASPPPVTAGRKVEKPDLAVTGERLQRGEDAEALSKRADGDLRDEIRMKDGRLGNELPKLRSTETASETIMDLESERSGGSGGGPGRQSPEGNTGLRSSLENQTIDAEPEMEEDADDKSPVDSPNDSRFGGRFRKVTPDPDPRLAAPSAPSAYERSLRYYAEQLAAAETRAHDDGVAGGLNSLHRLSEPEGEKTLRSYGYYQTLDPEITLETVLARSLRIPPPAVGDEGLGRELFRERYGVNPFVDTTRDRFATFAMDVDTASYTRTRALLRNGVRPDPETVRPEEFVNFFDFDFTADPESEFSVFCEGGPSPFGPGTELLAVTVKARDLRPGERQNAAITFAIDTSGSMFLEKRLALVKESLKRLLASLSPDDQVAIVAYGSQAYLALPHTPVREEARILGTLDSLSPGGSTNVQAGLDLAYRLADEGFQPRSLNRVVLLSDGVATEGDRSAERILEKVQVYARRGIYLSVIGFGRKRYNDLFLEQLADRGNGNYAYVDAIGEAERIFAADLPSTLHVLARDAKIQVEFDPATVSHYRLIGYENRDIRDEDFRNDAVDAGEVGPGSTVTALFEIRRHPAAHGALGRVFLRFHATSLGRVKELDFPLSPGVLAPRLQATSDRFRLTACLAELAELLRDSYWARDGSYAEIMDVLERLSPEFRARPEWVEIAELTKLAQEITLRQILSR